MKRMSEAGANLNCERMSRDIAALQKFVQEAALRGVAAHEVEKGIWEKLLQVGRSAFGWFLTSQGSGDLGETVKLPDGREVKRLAEQRRRLRTMFGMFTLKRVVSVAAIFSCLSTRVTVLG